MPLDWRRDRVLCRNCWTRNPPVIVCSFSWNGMDPKAESFSQYSFHWWAKGLLGSQVSNWRTNGTKGRCCKCLKTNEGGGAKLRNNFLPTFRGIITHTCQCMVFLSRRPCFGRICTSSFSTNQTQNKNDMVNWSLTFTCACAWDRNVWYLCHRLNDTLSK